MNVWKFGFELELYTNNSKYFPKNNKDAVSEEFVSSFFYKDKALFAKDQSLAKSANFVGFEINTPIYDADSFNEVSEFFKYVINSDDFFIDNSCSLHTHFSNVNLSLSDYIWILVLLSLDDEILNKIETFKGIKFESSIYAKFDYLLELRYAIKKNQIEKLEESIKMLFNKDSVFRIHPQGTIEWRGPREFLYETDNIKPYLDLLKMITNRFNQYLKISKAFNITKEQIDSMDLIKTIQKNKKEFNFFNKFHIDQPIESIYNIQKYHQWILNAKFKEAIIIASKDHVNFISGKWLDGRWEYGDFGKNDTYFGNISWENGIFVNGNFINCTWENGTFLNGHFIGNSNISDSIEFKNINILPEYEKKYFKLSKNNGMYMLKRINYE